MMTLTTVVQKKEEGSFYVFWRVGTKRKGVLNILLDKNLEDAGIVCELIATRYLALDKQVFCREPGGGTGYKLVVSKGAIKKLALGKSDKKNLTKFAAHVKTRLRGAEISVSQKMDFMPNLDECDIEILDPEIQEYTKTYDEIVTPAIGSVLVTQHAIEQYQARISTGDPKNPWASLVGRLQHPDIQVQTFDDKVARHKARKYGRVDNVEVWGHTDSKFKFLIVVNDDNEKRVLVTVFERKE